MRDVSEQFIRAFHRRLPYVPNKWMASNRISSVLCRTNWPITEQLPCQPTSTKDQQRRRVTRTSKKKDFPRLRITTTITYDLSCLKIITTCDLPCLRITTTLTHDLSHRRCSFFLLRVKTDDEPHKLQDREEGSLTNTLLRDHTGMVINSTYRSWRHQEKKKQ